MLSIFYVPIGHLYFFFGEMSIQILCFLIKLFVFCYLYLKSFELQKAPVLFTHLIMMEISGYISPFITFLKQSRQSPIHTYSRYTLIIYEYL